MTTVLKSFHKLINQFDKCTERFALHHPYLAFIAMFVGMPMFILGAVAASTTLIMLPFAFIFGW